VPKGDFVKKLTESKGCIYKLHCLVGPKKSYVGQHNNVDTVAKIRWENHRKEALNLNPKCPIHRAIKKYGWENFSREIIWQGKREKLHAKENFYITTLHTFIDDPNGGGYNLTLGGEGTRGFRHSEASKLKSSLSNKSTYTDPSLRERQAATQRGRTHTEKTKLKVSMGVRKFFAENPASRNHLSTINKGRKHTAQTRKKLSSALTGRALSETHKKNLALAQTGKKYTLESRLKMSNAHKGKLWSDKRRAAYYASKAAA
jgi:group I intron endonuclease